MISGINCFAYEENRNDSKKIGSNLKTFYWYGDSLNYSIPKKFKNCAPILEFVNNDRILAEKIVTSKIDSGFKYTLSATIIPQSIPDSIFQLPKGNFMEIRDTPIQSEKSKRPSENGIKIGGTKREID